MEDTGPGHRDKHQGAGPQRWSGRTRDISQGLDLTHSRTAARPTLTLSCPHLQEVLKHLQGKLEQEARVLVSSGKTEVLEQLKGEGSAWGPLYTLGQTLSTLRGI